MKTVQLIEALNYPRGEEKPERLANHHALICELASRVQELDSLPLGVTLIPEGVRIMQRLVAIERRSRRAYILILDLLTRGDSLALSFEELGSRHLNAQLKPCSRQSWLQNAKKDIGIVKQVWPEVGAAMEEIMVRRNQDK